MNQYVTLYRSPRLRAIIDQQGRRYSWVARQARISPTMLSKVMNGDRCLSEGRARRVAAVLQLPFDVLFELPTGTESVPVDGDAGAAQASPA